MIGTYGLVQWFFVLGALLPAALVLGTNRVSGFEKLGWTLVSLFLSWVGFTVFMIVMSTRASHAEGR